MKYIALILLILLGIIVPIFLFINRQKIDNRMNHSGYSWCEKCERTWDVVEGHITEYKKINVQISTWECGKGFTSYTNDIGSMGCFPLCKTCWTNLKTPENRLSYYQSFVNRRKLTNDWLLIKQSVLDGN